MLTVTLNACESGEESGKTATNVLRQDFYGETFPHEELGMMIAEFLRKIDDPRRELTLAHAVAGLYDFDDPVHVSEETTEAGDLFAEIADTVIGVWDSHDNALSEECGCCECEPTEFDFAPGHEIDNRDYDCPMADGIAQPPYPQPYFCVQVNGTFEASYCPTCPA